MKKTGIIFAVAAVLFMFVSCNREKKETENAAVYNEQRASELSEDIFKFIALIEIGRASCRERV